MTASVRLSRNYISFKIIDLFVALSCARLFTWVYSQDTRLTFIAIASRIKNSEIEFVKFVCPQELFSSHIISVAWGWHELMYKNLLSIAMLTTQNDCVQYNKITICDSLLRFSSVLAIVIIQTEKCKTSNQFGEKCEPMTIKIFFIIDWCVHSAVKT